MCILHRQIKASVVAVLINIINSWAFVRCTTYGLVLLTVIITEVKVFQQTVKVHHLSISLFDSCCALCVDIFLDTSKRS